jgi:ABC-type dipeptide/oligopeptide/nickel transport system ATPase subunit
LCIGLCLGTAAGYFGGLFDGIVLVVIDTLLAFPSLILALVIAGLLGQGLGNLVITMIAVYWVEYARLARSMTRTVREKTFVLAASASGSASGGIIHRHILPHILPPMLVYATLGMSHIIIGISSLSFIGLGVRPPFPEWGAMITEARDYMRESPLPLAATAFCIICSVACFQLLGEALRDRLDPRRSQLGLIPVLKRKQGKRIKIRREKSPPRSGHCTPVDMSAPAARPYLPPFGPPLPPLRGPAPVTPRTWIQAQGLRPAQIPEANPQREFTAAMLTVQEAAKTYPNGTRALRGVSLTLEKGEVLGLVGESGSGKSTLARLVCALEDRGNVPSGDILLDGLSYSKLSRCARQDVRRRVQMVFQDAAGSLDPRRTVFQALEEPLRNYKGLIRRELREEAAALLDTAGLDRAQGGSYPHQLSGGQRQRVVIARALAADPDYLICDEPVSSLDGETRDHILALLAKRVHERQLGCLFITHDVILAARMCRKILVMREGIIVDTVDIAHMTPAGENSFGNTYTRSLFAAASAGEKAAPC